LLLRFVVGVVRGEDGDCGASAGVAHPPPPRNLLTLLSTVSRPLLAGAGAGADEKNPRPLFPAPCPSFSSSGSSSVGDPGENDGNEVSDLSDGAIDDAQLDVCEARLWGREVPGRRDDERWRLLIEVVLCCETDRRSGDASVGEVAAVDGAVVSMVGGASAWSVSVCGGGGDG
jgi:hypothetical protein